MEVPFHHLLPYALHKDQPRKPIIKNSAWAGFHQNHDALNLLVLKGKKTEVRL
jgi:hypothetical protein